MIGFICGYTLITIIDILCKLSYSWREFIIDIIFALIVGGLIELLTFLINTYL